MKKTVLAFCILALGVTLMAQPGFGQCNDNDPTSPVGIRPTKEDFPGGGPVCGPFSGKRLTPGDGAQTIVFNLDGIAGNDVTVTISVGPCGEVLSWSVPAHIVIDKVYAKGSTDQNVYDYTSVNPRPTFDGNLHSPITGSGKYAGFSHIDFCFHYKVTLSKTATTTFTRTHNWTITKTVTPDVLNLFTGDAGTSQYTVSVDKTGFTDSDWAVSGTITILNNTPFAATIQSVADAISGFGSVTPNCGISYPYVLAAGGSLVCNYSSSLTDGSARVNTAVVTTSGSVSGGSATANVTFGSPTTEVNSTINVTDTFAGALGSASDDKTFTPYSRTFSCDRDEGTHSNTATIVETGQTASASVTVNCHALTVTKSAGTSLTRTWTWTIDKSADQTSLTLATGQTFTVNYTVMADATSTDSNWGVSGTITVHNPAPIAATINSVADLISGVGAVIPNCSVTFPYTLTAGGTLTCAYSSSLPNADGRTNTATATLQNYSYDKDGNATPSGTTDFSGTAAVDFSNASVTEVDECVAVSDNLQGTLGTVCYADAPKTFAYSRNIGPYADCGPHIVDNTAVFVTNDEGVTGDDNWTVNVNVPCEGGCTRTIGYWKTHAGFGPQADVVTQYLPQLLGTTGGAKTQNVTTAALAVQFLSFKGSNNAFDASNGINKLYAQLLAAKLNIAGGASNSAVSTTISAADAFLANNNSTNWSSLTKAQKNQVLSWMTTLDKYNNGLIGPGHCSEESAGSSLTLNDKKEATANELSQKGKTEEQADNSQERSEVNRETVAELSNDAQAALISTLPSQFALAQNYPNPFNPSTTFSFDLPKDSQVKLTIYNLTGQEVAVVFSGTLSAGRHTFTWEASANLISGIYFYKLQTAEFTSVKKMIFQK